jgi:TolB protein
MSLKNVIISIIGIGLVASVPSLAPAQEKIHIFVGSPGQNKFPIALPKPLGNNTSAQTFYEVVTNDLLLSGYVDIIDTNAYIEPIGTGLRPGEFDFEDWSITGAVGLAKTSYEFGETTSAEVWVYDVAGRRKIGAKSFQGTPRSARILAHKVASEIIFQLTGQSVPFNTRFVTVGDFTGNKEIYLIDFDGENRARLTRNGSINIKPRWSPTGNKVAFTSYLGGNPDLYVADLNKGKISRLSAREGLNTGASFAPDEQSMTITLSHDGNAEIYSINATSGRKISRLTKSYGIDTSAVYSPDGSKIAFVSERAGGAQIYVMNSDGSNPKRVTFQGSYNTDPSWSPDGSQIAFVNQSGLFDIYTVRTDGSGLQRITQDMGNNEDPSWSPDGNYVSFSSTRTGSSQIWMATKDGIHQMQLSKGRGNYTNPSWSPYLDW